MISHNSSDDSSDRARRSNTSRSKRKRELMSRTIWLPPISEASRMLRRSSALSLAARAALTTIVSLKTEAVSARVIGVTFCSSALPSRHAL
jgi:hypothetical protein